MQYVVHFRIKSAIVHNFRSFFLLVLRKESIFIPFFTKQVFMQDFVHLHVHTQYSILDGQASIPRLVDKAMADGMKGIAVTDHGDMFGIKEFFNYVKKKNGARKDKIKELQALIDSKDIDVTVLDNTEIDEASYFGRIFAHSGGLTEAVKQALKESGSEFEASPISCSGIEECRTALLRASKGVLPHNFIEGMACKDGCISGAGCLSHGEKNRKTISDYALSSKKKTIEESVKNNQ